MGTNADNTLRETRPLALSSNLSGDGLQQACDALAMAANALLAVASAIAPKDVSCLAPKIPAVPVTDPVTVGEAVSEFLRAKARAGRSDRYLRALRVSLQSFARGRFHKPLGDVTIYDLEQWIDANNWSLRTQAGYLSDVRVMFNFAMRRGLCASNPAAGVELPEYDEKLPCVHTPAQVRTALEFAREYDLNLCRALALRYFAGIRSIECDRSGEVNIKANHFEVTAANAKQTRSRRRRLIELQPNLRAWLALGGTIDFGNGGHRWRWFREALRAKRGLDMPDNVTRHTFVSYHVAHFGDVKRTAAESGHTEEILFSTYRELNCADGTLITPELAKEFWSILPAPVAK